MTTLTASRTGTLLGAALAVLTAVPATAASATPTAAAASIDAGRLVLTPTGRGYQGSLSVTVTNNSGAAQYYSIRITEPVAGSFRGLQPTGACVHDGRVAGRRILVCGVDGPDLKPGERRRLAVTFEVLTAPRPYPMSAAGGRVEVLPGDTGQVADADDFRTLFRGTDGSLRHPRPYVQDNEARASITTSVGEVRLTRQPDGRFAGRLPVTVWYAGDAPHDSLSVRADLPAGVEVTGTEPQDSPSFGGFFDVPGGRLSSGEERTFDVLFRAPAETAPGELGPVSLLLSTWYGSDEVADADPTDNAVTVAISAADNG
ncbi:hypothetical protein ACPFP2_08300 [Micromonospora citrea]|uniref:hypothetical protein n=1 Tax=Micromonospora citrea TaxID=47855 RepID=UPI003C4F2D80